MDLWCDEIDQEGATEIANILINNHFLSEIMGEKRFKHTKKLLSQ